MRIAASGGPLPPIPATQLIEFFAFIGGELFKTIIVASPLEVPSGAPTLGQMSSTMLNGSTTPFVDIFPLLRGLSPARSLL